MGRRALFLVQWFVGLRRFSMCVALGKVLAVRSGRGGKRVRVRVHFGAKLGLETAFPGTRPRSAVIGRGTDRVGLLPARAVGRFGVGRVAAAISRRSVGGDLIAPPRVPVTGGARTVAVVVVAVVAARVVAVVRGRWVARDADAASPRLAAVAVLASLASILAASVRVVASVFGRAWCGRRGTVSAVLMTSATWRKSVNEAHLIPPGSH